MMPLHVVGARDPLSMPKQDYTPNRLLVAVITIACFGGAFLLRQLELVDRNNTLLIAGLVRVGICMGALWFALPSRKRPAAWAKLSPWVIVGLAVAAFLLPRLRYSIPLLVGMLLVGTFIRPRQKPSTISRRRLPGRQKHG